MKGSLLAIDIGNIYGSPIGGTGGASIGTLITNIMQGAIALAGLVLLIMLIGSGIAIIAGAGSSKPESVEKAKKTATTALIGFILVVFAYLIVELIQGILGQTFITNPHGVL